LARWYGRDPGELGTNEMSRLAIERGLVCAHRHVFGVVAWYAVFGAAGAVLYRAADMLCEQWADGIENVSAPFARFARQSFDVLDWIPARLTAVAFAIVGDFEDALYCWRTQASAWADRGEAIVLAAGAGALGVRLGSAVGLLPGMSARPEIGTGEEADPELMTSAIGLVWRALVLWLFVILLLTLAGWLGSTRA
jgi:cobalamin biosynthesis protein CobD/CbiB